MDDSMRGQVARRYADIRYPSLVHPHTHPRRLAATARLFGLQPSDPATARVLELGSCDGANLIWFANTLPQAKLLGLELDANAVNNTNTTAQEQNLQDTLSFEVADLLEKRFGHQRFDYIVAHGFLSWVDEPEQQRLMEVCRDHLTPNGIAMISYNVMPGCSTHDALRRLLLLELNDTENSSSTALTQDVQLNAAAKVFDFFDTAIPDTTAASSPAAAKLLQSTQTLRKKHPQVLLHDEAGAVFEPFYFLQFAQWVAETELAYIADANFVHDWMDCYPKPLKQAIVDSQFSRLKAIQYSDYVLDTHFRSSMICHADQARHIVAAPDLDVLLDLHIRPLKNVEELDTQALSTGTHERTLLKIIGQHQEKGIAFAEAWKITKATFEWEDAQLSELYPKIARQILKKVCAGYLELTAGPITP